MWVLFASLNPVSEAFRSMFAKKASRHVEPIIISWFNNFIPLILFTPLIFFLELRFSFQFWYAFLATGTINAAATIFYMRAISEGELSAVMPMLSFTPLFLLVTSPILIGEFPAAPGLAGILLIVAGSYILNIKAGGKGLFYPFKSLLKNRGTRYMLIVAFIWSFSANFDKISIQSSSLLQHIIFMNIYIFSILTLYVFFAGKVDFQAIKKARGNLLIVSAFTTGSFIFHMTALSLTLVAYVVAMKRMSGVISVFLGSFFFGEEGLRKRLAGSLLMFAGVLLIVLT